ncbi:hypothetical protein VTI28DRAFT_206 [Corynascus sepedonium]
MRRVVSEQIRNTIARGVASGVQRVTTVRKHGAGRVLGRNKTWRAFRTAPRPPSPSYSRFAAGPINRGRGPMSWVTPPERATQPPRAPPRA